MSGSPRTALVTGGAGFIGSHLVDALLAGGWERVVVVDNFFLGRSENLRDAERAGGVIVHREDAADAAAMAAIMDAEQPDVVYDLATKALLYSFFNPSGACKVNLDIALVLGDLLRRGAYGQLVHLSSSEVYGSARTVPMDEDHPMLAETTYAAGKAAADLALLSYQRMFDLDIRIVRPFNNYGPRQNDASLAAIIPLTIRRLLAGEPPVLEGDGAQTRDFIFVADTVRALLALAGEEGARGQVVNLGSGQETSIEELVRAIMKELDYDGPVDRRPRRVADVDRHCADVTRAEALIGPIALTPLAAGIASTVAWYRSTPAR